MQSTMSWQRDGASMNHIVPAKNFIDFILSPPREHYIVSAPLEFFP